MPLPHVAVAAGGKGYVANGLIGRRQLLHTEILQRDRVARSGIRFAELQPEGQRSMRSIRRHDLLHMIRTARRKGAPVQGSIGVLVISVEADLVFGLIAAGAEVILDPVGSTGLRGHAGVGVELDLPNASSFGGRLGNAQRGAVGGLGEIHHIIVVMPLIDGVRPAVRELGQRHILIIRGRDRGIVLPVVYLLVQRKPGRERIFVFVGDLLHAYVAHRHIDILRGAANGELQHQFSVGKAGFGESEDLLDSRQFPARQMAAVEGTVALLLLVPVQEHLKVHILVAQQIRADAVGNTGLRRHAGADIKPCLPHRGVMADREIVHRDRVAAAHHQGAVLRIVALHDHVLAVELQSTGQDTLIAHIVLHLHDLDLAEIDRKGAERTELEIQIAGAVLRDYKAGQLVVALRNLEFLKIAELDRAGYIRAEAISDTILVAGDRGIVALELDVPGFSIRLSGRDPIHAVHKLGGAGNLVAFEFCAEQRRRAFFLRSGVRRRRAEREARQHERENEHHGDQFLVVFHLEHLILLLSAFRK